MGVRSNTDGKLTRATDLPVNATGWTWCGWIRSTATEAAYRVPFLLGGAAGIYGALIVDTGTLNLSWSWNALPGFFDTPMLTLTDEVPVFVAIKCISATEIEVLWREDSAGSLSTTGVLTIGAATWTNMYALGSDVAGEEWSNGDARTFGLWHAALSDVEILAQSFSESPLRTANIDSFLTLLDATDPGDDESGNGRDWTASGTFATVAWSTFPRFQARSRGQDVAPSLALPRRLRPLAAFGGAPPVADQPPGRRARAIGEVVRVEQLRRKALSFAAVAQGAPVPIPGPRRRAIGDRAAFGAALVSDPPLRRVLSLAAAAYVPPVPGVPSARRRIDVRRNRARMR